jgi:large subunit ribosomal protein L21
LVLFQEPGPSLDKGSESLYIGVVINEIENMLAVIKTGGKQYKVKVGDKIKIEKLEGEEGSTVSFPEVLFVGDDSKVKVGDPFVAGAKVEGKILKTAKGKKVTGIKHKPKKRYKVKFGHRQTLTEVEITSIA